MWGAKPFAPHNYFKVIVLVMEEILLHEIIQWEYWLNPNRSLGLVVFRNFRRMNFACLLMSDSELLRIKNKRKASYKSRKTARSILKNHHTHE